MLTGLLKARSCRRRPCKLSRITDEPVNIFFAEKSKIVQAPKKCKCANHVQEYPKLVLPETIAKQAAAVAIKISHHIIQKKIDRHGRKESPGYYNGSGAKREQKLVLLLTITTSLNSRETEGYLPSPTCFPSD